MHFVYLVNVNDGFGMTGHPYERWLGAKRAVSLYRKYGMAASMRRIEIYYGEVPC